ncbi:uncharacterized protein ACBR49_019431 isoform 2-T2 [Aulostomus maculatus]
MRIPAVFLLLAIVEQAGSVSATNIAGSGLVSQSSLFEDATPERAIDGYRTSLWVQGSCSHTEYDLKPWWRLDLLKRYKITSVTITNRGDCCHERLNRAEIRIGDSLDDNGNANPRCTQISSIPAGATETFECNEMEGRYINIVVPGRREYLTLCEVEVSGQLAAVMGDNIARGGLVSQSSLYEDANPERAIDGYRTSLWQQKSCTHTHNDLKPWWRLDLLQPYKITNVTITNRGDCCHERLNGAEIRIGDSLDDNGNANPRCTQISSIPAGATETFECNEMEGRFINIVVPGRREYLTLCEVEVRGQVAAVMESNVAGGGRVRQSSLYEGGVPERAIDGNNASSWVQGSCSHTNNDLKPWWRLDLLKRYKITSVTITNRGDCCHERLNGAEIRIGDSLDDNGNANPRCTQISSIPAGATETFECNEMEGHYINIVVPGRREYLTLCEVEVSGQLTAVMESNVAGGGRVRQSSSYEGGVPEKAIDGNHASSWVQGFCSHTEYDLKPWWRLDLLKRYKITSVTITNRGDCCHERLNRAEIRIGDSLDDNGNANPRCAVISSIPAGTSENFACHGMIGCHVNIVIPGRREYLTLCEVEVNGEESDDSTEHGCS